MCMNGGGVVSTKDLYFIKINIVKKKGTKEYRYQVYVPT